jgi:hypothetical protein
MVVGWLSEFYRSWLQDSSISKIETWVSSIWHTLINILLGMDYLYHLVLLPHRFYARPWSFSNFTRPKKVLFFPSGERRCYCSVFHKAKAIQVSEYETNFPHSLTYVHVGFKLIVCLSKQGWSHSLYCLGFYWMPPIL